jgi:integrase
MATALPYRVTQYTNASGTTSFRVTGSWNGERTRENYANEIEANAVCEAKNAAALAAIPTIPTIVIQTRAKEAEVRALEVALDRISNRWDVTAVLNAGIMAMETKAPGVLVGPLAETWLKLIEDQVSSRWLSDLRHRVRKFVADNPGLMTDKFDRATVRKWLDELPHAQQSKANMRNAVHRWAGWLVERGHLIENPAGEIRITRRKSGAQQADQGLPSIFTPRQCDALLRACELGACRRLLGWMAACLFTGIRPDSEAPRAEWAEVNFQSGEWSVMGRKRGAKPRVVKLTPAALAWMKVAKADAVEKPALYSRRAKERAIELANEWLANNHPPEKPIAWDGDITRHSFASYRSPQIPVHDLAAEMGNSPGTIYAHYRHPQPASEVKAFWALRPRG